MQRKLKKIEKREADETAALENMVQMVEKNLELTTVITKYICNGKVKYNSGCNRASNFVITSTITPELYDTRSNYQLIVSITKIEVRESERTSF